MSDRVLRIFSEILCLPIEMLSDGTSPSDTPQWDSLKVMDLVLAIEGEFDVRLSTREIMAMRSIALVKKFLREKGINDV
jgi:acyl carrier protein